LISPLVVSFAHQHGPVCRPAVPWPSLVDSAYDRLHQEVSILRQAMRVKDARMAQIDPDPLPVHRADGHFGIWVCSRLHLALRVRGTRPDPTGARPIGPWRNWTSFGQTGRKSRGARARAGAEVAPESSAAHGGHACL